MRLNGTEILKDSLTVKINELTKKANVQGLAVAVFNENKAIYQKSFGYKDNEKN